MPTVGDLTLKILLDIKDLLSGHGKVIDVLKSIDSKSNDVSKSFNNASQSTIAFRSKIQDVGQTIQGLQNVFMMLSSSVGMLIKKYNEFQSAQLGLQSVAKFKAIDPLFAVKTVQDLDLVKNGLLSLADASTSLKNLLASNFTLEQSIELIRRFGDSSAFGRQSSLSFGEAVRSATEGVKNGNSILVDNSGVTKNLSLILEEAGYSAQDLMKASTDAGVRMALFNGILKETQGQLGDADKLLGTSQGAMVRFDKSLNDLKISAGEAMSAFIPLLAPVKSLFEFLNILPEPLKRAAASIAIVTAAIILFNGSLPLAVKAAGYFLAVAQILPGELKFLVGGLVALSGVIVGVSSAFQLLTASATASTVATTAATMGLNIAIAAIVAGGFALLQGYNETSNSVEKLNQKISESTKVFSETDTKIATVQKNLSDLNVITNIVFRGFSDGAGAMAIYDQSLNNIKNTFPGLYILLKQQTVTLDEQKSAVMNLVSEQEAYLKLLVDARNLQYLDFVNTSLDKHKEESKQIEKLSEQIQEYNSIKSAGGEWDTNLLGEGDHWQIWSEESEQKLQAAELQLKSLTANTKEAELGFYNMLKGSAAFGDEATKLKNVENTLNLILTSAQNNTSQQIALTNAIKLLGVSGNVTFQNLASGVHNFTLQIMDAINKTQQASNQLSALTWQKQYNDAKEKVLTNINVKDPNYKKEIDKQAADIKKTVKDYKEASDYVDKAFNWEKPQKTSAPKSYSSKSSEITKDPVDELIKSYQELIKIYYSADDVKKQLNESGENEAAIIAKINDEISASGKYTKEQILKLEDYRKSLSTDTSVNFKFEDPEDPQQFIDRYTDALYKQWQEKVEKYGPIRVGKWDYEEALQKALKAYQESRGLGMQIEDYERLIIYIKQDLELNDQKKKNQEELLFDYNQEIDLKNKILKYEKEIIDLKYKQIQLASEIANKKIEVFSNDYIKKYQEIIQNFRDEQDKINNRFDKKEIDGGQRVELLDIAAQKKRNELEKLKKEFRETIYSAFSSALSAINNIVSQLGIGANTFVAKLISGLQTALSIVESIKAILEAVSILNAISKIVSGGMFSPFGGGGFDSLGGGLPPGPAIPGGFKLPGNVNQFFQSPTIAQTQHVPYILRITAKGRDLAAVLERENISKHNRSL